jgi:hypothetical protein
MSADDWLEGNNRYLGASLQWLRARLHAMARDKAVPPAGSAQPPSAPTPTTPGLLDRLRGIAPPVFATGTSPAVRTRKPDAAPPAADRDEAAKTDPPPALVVLARNFGLSDFERDTLLLCAAAELDPAMGTLFAAAQGNAGRSYPTFALALQAFAEPSWDALSAHRPLRYLRLLEINQPGATPLTAAALRADERVVNYIKGLNVVDERLSALLAVSAAGEAPALAPSQQTVAEDIVAYLRLSASSGDVPLVELLGADTGSKYDVATQVCAALNRRLYRIALDAMPNPKAEIENLARLWQRESLMLPVALYVDAEEIDGASHELGSALHWFLSRDLGLIFVGLREPPARSIDAGYAVEVRKPKAQEQRTAWIEALRSVRAGDAERSAAVLAGQFNLNLRDIRRISSQATHVQAATSIDDKIWDACCSSTRPRLDLLAQRIEPKAAWDDLVLPPEALGLLRQIAAQVRGRHQVYEEWGYAKKMTRGLGISALFAGESGTGKTMAAEVLANELRLTLYRIDLSAVVSKYIGETEKNLRKLFDAAEQGGAILFFDEADALFGKRSEVKDSHDRYANIEINYLLQRMEAFSGLAILATNMKSALDQAFMRRLRFIVNFPFPGVAERMQIWQKALAPEVPRTALDYERLARFNLSGGNIHSIALNAAFTAAQRTDADRAVTMPLLLSATRGELRKLDKQVNEADFRAMQPTRGAA